MCYFLDVQNIRLIYDSLCKTTAKVKEKWRSFGQNCLKLNQVVILYAQYAECVIGNPKKYEKIIRQ